MFYFDYAATTPVDKEVFDEMKKYFCAQFGNPSSYHKFGQSALKAIDFAREKIKNILEADSIKEIIFTGSATESNNLLIKGLAFDYFFKHNSKPHLISSEIEHPSVIEPLINLEWLKIAEITLIKPNKTGLINFSQIEKEIRENTILISLHYVNSEIGVIQNITEIAKGITEINKSRRIKIIFHTDAAQVLTEDISVKNLGIDAMTLSGHKIYAPKGIGLLYKKENIKLESLISGSEQEFGLRAGTENVAGIVGFTKALQNTRYKIQNTKKHLIELRNYFVEKLKFLKIKFEINGDINYSSPKILNVYFENVGAQDLLLYLSQNEIYASAGMSCKSRALIPSSVVNILHSEKRAKNSVRFSFGKNTTKEEIDYLINALSKYISI